MVNNVKVILEENWGKMVCTAGRALKPLHKGTPGAAAWDLRSYEHVVISPGLTEKISTGMRMELPDNIYMEIFSRSGLGLQGVIEAKGVGIVDSDYRGLIFVTIKNTTDLPFEVLPGDRIAQGVFKEKTKITVDFMGAESYILSSTERDNNGFGSTGIK